MKKIFSLLLLISPVVCSYSQKMQATIKPGNTAGTIDVYLKPSGTFSQKDEALTFALAIPTTIQPAPSLGTSGTTTNSLGLVQGITGLQPTFVVNNLGTTQREVVVTNESISGDPHYIFTFIFAGTATVNHDCNIYSLLHSTVV
jgi:hypothetical protein